MIRGTIRSAMKIRNIKAKDIADFIGVSKSSMSLFLNGKMNFGQDKLEKIFEFLKIELQIKE